MFALALHVGQSKYSLRALEDIQAIVAINDVEQTITVVEDIVTLSRTITLGRIRNKISHFLRAIRICNIHEAQTAAKPGNPKDGIVDLLLRLMAAESPRAIFDRGLGHDVIGYRYWVPLVSDVTIHMNGGGSV